MTGREWQFGWYAQDRWQATRKLTVTLGLRYEYFPLMTRSNGKGLERLDPATNLVYLGGRGNVPVDNGITVSKKLFAPRIGLAYRITESTVIRAGYGLNYDPLPFSRPLRGFYPLTINKVYNPANSYVPVGSLRNRDSTDRSSPISQHGYRAAWATTTCAARMPARSIADISRAGTSRSSGSCRWTSSCPAPMSARRQRTSSRISTSMRAPEVRQRWSPVAAKFGRTANTNMWDGYLSANYHSLQTTINKQFSKGLLIKGAYT